MQTHYIRIHTTKPALDRTIPHRKQKRDFVDQCSRRPPLSLWIHADPKSRNQKNFIWMRLNARGSKPPSHNFFAWTSLDQSARGNRITEQARQRTRGTFAPFFFEEKKSRIRSYQTHTKDNFFQRTETNVGIREGSARVNCDK